MKTEIIETDRYPYAMIENVFNEHELIDVLDFVKDRDRGDKWLDSSCGDMWHLLQQKAWDIHDALYDVMKEKTVNPINPHVNEEGRNSFFRIQLKRLEPGFERNAIHRDSEWKQFVVVTYLSDEGDGTYLYKENDPSTHYKTIPFVKNNAYAHIPCEKSWHDFAHPEHYKDDRISIMFLLADTRYYK